VRLVLLASLFVMTVAFFLTGLDTLRHVSVLLIFWAFMLSHNLLYLRQVVQKIAPGQKRKESVLAQKILGGLNREQIARYGVRGIRNFNAAFVLWLCCGVFLAAALFYLSIQEPETAYLNELHAQIRDLFDALSYQPRQAFYDPVPVALKNVVYVLLPGFVFMSVLSASLRSTQQEILTWLSCLFFFVAAGLSLPTFHFQPGGELLTDGPILGGAYFEIAGRYQPDALQAYSAIAKHAAEYGPLLLFFGAALIAIPFLICLQGWMKKRLSLLQLLLALFVCLFLTAQEFFAPLSGLSMVSWVSGLSFLALLWTQSQHSGQRVYRMYR